MTSLRLGLLLLVLPLVSTGQTYHISGTYTDKQNDPIAGADVQYYDKNDIFVDATQTDPQGAFTLEVVGTGAGAPSGVFRRPPSPNPFSGRCGFTLALARKAVVLVTDTRGVMVDKAEAGPGVYQGSWGGRNRIGRAVSPGSYMLVIQAGGRRFTRKVVFSGGPQSALEMERRGAFHKAAAAIDSARLHFEREGTSPLDYPIAPVSSDTTVGTITGNIGPEATGTIAGSQVITGPPPVWNLNDYFTNDDQSIYIVAHEGFIIEQDTLLTTDLSQAGSYSATVEATDAQDETLQATTPAQVEVEAITISGTYLDKQGQPIEGAQVAYHAPQGQVWGTATTGSEGAFEVEVTGAAKKYKPSKPHRSDSAWLHFQGTNSSSLDYMLPAIITADTTVGTVTGNIGPEATGAITGSFYTGQGDGQWNLNDYFTNDDQSLYSVEGAAGYTIVQDTLLVFAYSAPGSYEAVVTATDPQDGGLAATTTAQAGVELLLAVPDSQVEEDTDQEVLYEDLDVFLNPGFSGEVSYSITGESNPGLIDLAVDGTAVVIDELAPDQWGSSEVSLEYATETGSDITTFTVTVTPMVDVQGQVRSFFDSTLMAGVEIEVTLDSTVFYNTTTDAEGAYHLQLPPQGETTYFRITLSHEGYAPFHSWVTVPPGNGDVDSDYRLITLDMHWLLYNEAFRYRAQGFLLDNQGKAPIHWIQQPDVLVFNDSTITGGVDIEPNVETMLINLETILPTFNPVDFNHSKVEVKQDTSNHTTSNYEVLIYWWDECSGGGAYGLGIDEHEIIDGSICFLPMISPDNPNDSTYNQELGSAFGATYEPPTVDPADTVFLTGGGTTGYTEHDYDGADVYLNRSLAHYRNLSFDMSDPEGWDWELRPDLVEDYYPSLQGRKPKLTHFITGIRQPDGSIEHKRYAIDKVPLEVKKQFPFSFPEANPGFFNERQQDQKATESFKKQFRRNRAIEKHIRAQEAKQQHQQTKPNEKAAKKTPPSQKQPYDPVNPPNSR